MKKLHIAIIYFLFITSITILLIGVFREIQGYIIGGVVSIFGSIFITITLRINAATTIPITVISMPKNMEIDIKNPIYEI